MAGAQTQVPLALAGPPSPGHLGQVSTLKGNGSGVLTQV